VSVPGNYPCARVFPRIVLEPVGVMRIAIAVSKHGSWSIDRSILAVVVIALSTQLLLISSVLLYLVIAS